MWAATSTRVGRWCEMRMLVDDWIDGRIGVDKRGYSDGGVCVAVVFERGGA